MEFPTICSTRDIRLQSRWFCLKKATLITRTVLVVACRFQSLCICGSTWFSRTLPGSKSLTPLNLLSGMRQPFGWSGQWPLGLVASAGGGRRPFVFFARSAWLCRFSFSGSVFFTGLVCIFSGGSYKGDGARAFSLIGRNSSTRTQEWFPPQKIRCIFLSARDRSQVKLDLVSVSPRPSCPSLLFPHTYMSPFADITTEWWAPAPINYIGLF